MTNKDRLVVWLFVGLIFSAVALLIYAGSQLVNELQTKKVEDCFKTADVCEQINGRWYPYNETYS